MARKAKNENHWAVVVGINRYPGYDGRNLVCPAKDAEAFESWLLDPAGGNLPQKNIQRVSKVLPKKMTIKNAAPTERAIHDAIQKAYLDGHAVVQKKASAWAKTRLYLFLSGHGISLHPEDASLQGADAHEKSPGRYVSSSALKNFFQVQPYFRDLVIFADCCRDDYITKLKEPKVLDWEGGQAVGGGPPEIVILYAAEFGDRTSEETDGPEEERQSYFTRCLLEALHGDPSSSKTVDASGIFKRIKCLYGQLAQTKPNVGTMRALMTDPDMKFGVTGKTPGYRTELKAPHATFVRVRGDGDYIPLSSDDTPGTFSAFLPAGKYEVQFAGKNRKYKTHPDWLTVLPGYNEKTL
jgi:hypothetical protein